MTAILLRMARLDPFDADTETARTNGVVIGYLRETRLIAFCTSTPRGSRRSFVCSTPRFPADLA
jgi:hypothetical protein